MKLSSDTLAVLKNFASINSNIVFRGGPTVKTMSEAKNILASATLAEDFPAEFGIYDLNEFLGVVSMFESPELDFSNVEGGHVQIVEGGRSVKYFFSDPEILTSPTKDIQMPAAEVTFVLSDDDLTAIRRAASTMSVSDVVIESDDSGELQATVTDTSDATSNSFSIKLKPTRMPDGTPFRFVYNVANFKLMGGTDYNVEVSSKLISHLKGSNNIEYWIALEKSSTFGN
jgi:hypothetical protein